jgi:hypothetical protein
VGPLPIDWGVGDYVECIDIDNLDPYFGDVLRLERVYRVYWTDGNTARVVGVEGGFFQYRFRRAAINNTRAGRALARKE